MSDYIVKALNSLTMVVEKCYLDSKRRKLKYGEIDYSMSEVADDPIRTMCPMCKGAMWSFEQHISSVENWNTCKVVNVYERERDAPSGSLGGWSKNKISAGRERMEADGPS